MEDQTNPHDGREPGDSEPGDSEPGERRAGGGRLAVPPSARYGSPPRGAAEASRSPVGRAVILAGLISLLGAATIVLLAGVLSVTAGLLAAIALTGLAIGRTVRGAGDALSPTLRMVLALIFVLDAVALGNAGTWVFALAEGGVLGPIEYLSETFGPLIIGEIVVGGTAALLTLR